MRTETGFHKEPLKGCLKASLCCTVLHTIVYLKKQFLGAMWMQICNFVFRNTN